MSRRARWSVGIAAAAVFAVLALQVVLHGPLTRVDLALTADLAAHRSAWLTQAMLFVSDANETGKLLAIALLLAAWRWWRGARHEALSLLVVPAGELLNLLLKNAFQRPRPVLALPLVHLSTFSFPSGHAVASTVFYGAACALVFRHTRSAPLRTIAGCIAAGMVLLVCASRVYLGAHYLSDVLAGIAVGCACLAFILPRTTEGP
jgi:undecaprenyl-diphosphatase